MRALPLTLAACTGPAVDGLSPSNPADDDGVARAELQLSLPLSEPERFGSVLGVDHDPEVQEDGIGQLVCLDYAERSFPHCYDEHLGTDYVLQGGFDAMDAGSSPIVAAAPGVVVFADDGHYDRCHGDLSSGGNDCDGYEMNANEVTLLHESGHTTRYLHMKKDSVAVEEGDEVDRGDLLGLVGSSGNSFTPHLHLQVHDADEVVVDPYAGQLSQAETYWCDQGDADDLPGGC